MKKCFLLIVVFFISVLSATAQIVGDYRTKQSGNWNDPAIWEIYNGINWVPAIISPDQSSGFINLIAPHIVTSSNDWVVDDVTIEVGAALSINSGIFVVNAGGVLICNGTLKIAGGTYNSVQITDIDGLSASLIWEAGNIAGNVTISGESTIDINGPGIKSLNGANMVFSPTTIVNWNADAGDINCNNSSMDIAGILNQFSNGKLINTGGTNTVTTTGTINIPSGKIFNASPNFIQIFNSGATLIGSGTFDGSGSNAINVNTNLSIQAGLTWTMGGTPSDLIGSGFMNVPGKIEFLSGHVQIPVTIEAGGILELNSASNKFLSSSINILNGGVLNHIDGVFAGNNANINNAGVMNISCDKPWQIIPLTNNIIHILPNGEFKKTSGTGTTAIDWKVIEDGLFKVESGTVWQKGDFTSTGAITVTGANSYLTTTGISNYNAGATFNGTNFHLAGGESFFNTPVTFPAGSTFFLNGAATRGTGPVIIEGIFNFTKGDSDVPVKIAVGATGNIYAPDIKKIFKEMWIEENGTGNFYAGETQLYNTIFKVDGQLNSSPATGFPVILTNSSGASELVFSDGAILSSTNGSGVTIINVPATIDATVRGIGLIDYQDPLSEFDFGISLGFSPGILTLNSVTPLLNNNTTIEVEILNGSGPGTGHDQLRRAGNLVLDGTLNVTQTGSVPLGSYTIISLTSGTITGSFDVVNLPPGYSIGQTATTVFVSKLTLPLHLLSFSANKKENSIQLDWKTTGEDNTSHFEIEHSANGISFSTLGRVDAAVNSNTTLAYQFTDRQPVPVNYYRLKMFDQDGKFTYSKIVKVDLSKTVTVRIVPNPANDLIEIQGAQDFKKIEIFDDGGRLVLQFISSSSRQQYSIRQLQPGIYWMRMRNDKEEQTVRFIKQ